MFGVADLNPHAHAHAHARLPRHPPGAATTECRTLSSGLSLAPALHSGSGRKAKKSRSFDLRAVNLCMASFSSRTRSSLRPSGRPSAGGSRTPIVLRRTSPACVSASVSPPAASRVVYLALLHLFLPGAGRGEVVKTCREQAAGKCVACLCVSDSRGTGGHDKMASRSDYCGHVGAGRALAKRDRDAQRHLQGWRGLPFHTLF